MIYLFLSPHPDDVELSCGATIAKLKDDVHIAVFSDCDIDMSEVSKAHEVLGVTTHIHYFERRKFPELRQQILDTLLELKDLIKPDIVFMPREGDTHQDHQVIAQEGLRAFKSVDCITYCHPHNQVSNDCNYFVRVGEEEMMTKIKSLSRYRSQVGRFYFQLEAIKGIARYYGVQCQTEYAEAFKIIRKYD